ncbi:MAG TPA: ATP-binding cassette domain-containing protein [Saprospiraceae bacterium]|nr:ATP-binding cassette domain-containing protein [Saprospiraceae bacterium]
MDILIEGLSKAYENQKAVDNISFEVRTGEIVGFLGPNGAGKTTTMKMITQFISPDSGRITIGGKVIAKENIRGSIGYLPENNPLYEDMPVMDYLAFCGQLQGIRKNQLDQRVREMIVMCGLNEEKHKKIGELSKGYRQRVGLAQAMIHDPAILILDEPTTGLDPNQRVEIRELIKRLGMHKSVILSTHILPEVEATCDRILIINKGQIVANGTAETLRSQATGKSVLLVDIEGAPRPVIEKELRSMPGITGVGLSPDHRLLEIECTDSQQTARSVYKMCVSKDWMLLQMSPVETRLEDIFRNVTLN